MKTFYKIILFTVAVGVIAIFINGYQTNEKIKRDGIEGICRFMYCKEFPKTTEANFAYYVDGKLYKNSYSSCPDDYENIEGRYFSMKYLKENPNKFIANFAKEITDSTEIRNAGFKMIK